jgi:hypothetical protein
LAAVAAGEAVLPAPLCAVTDCGHPFVAVAPGDAAVCDEMAREPAGLVTPPGEVPVPTGVPLPSVVDPPGEFPFPPVSTFELTCTISWRNEGTPSAMLAMNATPATTPTGRSQLTPA